MSSEDQRAAEQQNEEQEALAEAEARNQAEAKARAAEEEARAAAAAKTKSNTDPAANNKQDPGPTSQPEPEPGSEAALRAAEQQHAAMLSKIQEELDRTETLFSQWEAKRVEAVGRLRDLQTRRNKLLAIQQEHYGAPNQQQVWLKQVRDNFNRKLNRAEAMSNADIPLGNLANLSPVEIAARASALAKRRAANAAAFAAQKRNG